MEKTVTVEELVEAYKISGIKPKRCGFRSTEEDGTKCGCALTALALTLGFDFYDEQTVINFLILKGYEQGYLWSIAFGFDESDVNNIKDGYSVGLKAWKIIYGEN